MLAQLRSSLADDVGDIDLVRVDGNGNRLSADEIFEQAMSDGIPAGLIWNELTDDERAELIEEHPELARQVPGIQDQILLDEFRGGDLDQYRT